jgi:ERCC4-type nuclease
MSTYDITVDFREAKLIELLQKGIGDCYGDITMGQSNLFLGDITIHNGDIIIERKTWADLEASIKDGRYEEQSHRLKEAKEEGYNIYYFLEGDLSRHRGSLNSKTLISTVYSLTRKGFYVIQTKNLEDTALYILQFTSKGKKDLSKNKLNTYESVSLNKKKNSHITKENISVYMLSQIPGISTTNATSILERFDGKITNLILEIQTNPNVLDGITQTTKDGKKRKISKTILENIKTFLSKNSETNFSDTNFSETNFSETNLINDDSTLKQES